MIETSPPADRKKVASLLKQLKLESSTRAKSQERIRSLEEAQDRIYESGPIAISEEVAAGVLVEIGEAAQEYGIVISRSRVRQIGGNHRRGNTCAGLRVRLPSIP